MQTILPYSRDSLQQCPQFAPVSPVAATDTCNTCNKRKELSAHPSEVRNEKELTKSASVMDPAVLLSPTSHYPMNTTTGMTSTRTPYFSSRRHRWAMSRRREPGDAIVYHADHADCTARTQSQTQVVAHCAVRTQPSYGCGNSISRARSAAAGTKVKARRHKRRARQPDYRCRVASALVLSLFFIIDLFRRMCVPRQYFFVIELVYNIFNYRNIRKRCFPLQLTLIHSTCCVNGQSSPFSLKLYKMFLVFFITSAVLKFSFRPPQLMT